MEFREFLELVKEAVERCGRDSIAVGDYLGKKKVLRPLHWLKQDETQILVNRKPQPRVEVYNDGIIRIIREGERMYWVHIRHESGEWFTAGYTYL